MITKLLTCLSCLICFSIISRSQCGLDPTSGTVTISTASQIVNSYYPGQGNPTTGTTSLTVGTRDTRGSSTTIATGDLILIIQMQGADINSANSSAYGDGVSGGASTGYLNSNLFAGYYEYNSVASVAGSTITLSFSLANNYYTRNFSSGAIRRYQVIRIPRYYNLTISGSGSVTAPSWNGSSGGVVVLDAANVFTISGSISVAGLGFRGGGGINLTGATTGNTNGSGALTNTDHRWNSPITTAANLSGGAKGEGIAGTPAYVLTTGSTTITTNTVEGYTNGSMGRGAPANAGGGGTDGSPVGSGTENQYNTGGGGGANAGAGGKGGSGWHGSVGTDATTFPTGGNGGTAFAERSIQRLIMGGGGGAGTANNSTAANQYMSSGGAGGGIILLRAKSFAGNGTLNANGSNAIGVSGSGGNTDAAGGGGAGGTIVAVTRLTGTVGLNSVAATAKGGNGGNMETYYDHGPGGGGGGGMIITNGSFASTNVSGGSNGLTRTGSTSGPINNVYGSSAGGNGQVVILASAPTLKNANNAASPCGVLPVTLLSFRATLSGNAVLLSWEVDNAVDFSYFVVEYSTNGSDFTALGNIYYINGQTAYQYLHSSVSADVNYYRLRMVDLDGSARYSHVLVVKNSITGKELSVYPQPAKSYVTAAVYTSSAQSTFLQLFNSAGKKVREMQILLNRGNNLFTIDNLQNLPAGMYFLKTSIDEKILTAKLLLSSK